MILNVSGFIAKFLKQKLVVADDSGTLSCFEFKKGEPQVVFQMKPFGDDIISSIALGGDKDKNDKVYMSIDIYLSFKYFF